MQETKKPNPASADSADPADPLSRWHNVGQWVLVNPDTPDGEIELPPASVEQEQHAVEAIVLLHYYDRESDTVLNKGDRVLASLSIKLTVPMRGKTYYAIPFYQIIGVRA